MTGLLSLLVYAALFYLMMRFGCGVHMIQGYGGHEQGNARRGLRPASIKRFDSCRNDMNG